MFVCVFVFRPEVQLLSACWFCLFLWSWSSCRTSHLGLRLCVVSSQLALHWRYVFIICFFIVSWSFIFSSENVQFLGLFLTSHIYFGKVEFQICAIFYFYFTLIFSRNIVERLSVNPFISMTSLLSKKVILFFIACEFFPKK